jgi:V/A-type H+/Na+-transporting ATPase subunit D
MAQMKVVPTKSNLLRLKRDLLFAEEGYSLLDQKRQMLVLELMALMGKTEAAQNAMEKSIAEAFDALRKAMLSGGRASVERVAPAVNYRSDVSIHFRRVMGVHLPMVAVESRDAAPYFSPGETSIWTEEAIVRFKEALAEIGKLAELKISLMRLSDEVRKTMRRVNALEKIAIPTYHETIKYIQDSLEEADRGMIATLKQVKQRLEKKRQQPT